MKFGLRTIARRGWLGKLRLDAVANALAQGGDITPQIMESARVFCEFLDKEAIPGEPAGGLVGSTGRLFREKLTHGIRYPQYQGRTRELFWRRLYLWVRRTAESDAGADVLNLVGLASGQQAAADFARRVIGRTLVLLHTPVESESQDAFRQEMSDELNFGLTEDQKRQRSRIYGIIIRSLAAGATTVAVTELGFGRDIIDALSLGGLIAIATGVADTTIGGLSGLTASMLAARQQARDWLMTLTALLTHYVVWTDTSVRLDTSGSGIQRLVHLLGALVAKRAELSDLPQDRAVLLRGLEQILQTAERANDSQLQGALINLQTAVLFNLDTLPDAISRLLSMVQDIPVERGPGAAAALEYEGNWLDGLPKLLPRPGGRPTDNAEDEVGREMERPSLRSTEE